jgi:bacterial/archaeal transporter family-2 protein
MKLLLVVLALLMGAASTIQGASNGTLAGRLGLTSAVLVNALVVFTGAVIAWSFTRRPLVVDAPTPWYLYLGGCYGLLIIGGAAFAFPRLGAGPTTALMVTGQLTLALVLDHFGLPQEKVPVTPMRLCGALCLVVGALLVLWPKLFPRALV